MYDPVTLPPNVSEEMANRIAKDRIRQYHREYRAQHPDRVIEQRCRTYANFLQKHGYQVIAPADQEGGEA